MKILERIKLTFPKKLDSKPFVCIRVQQGTKEEFKGYVQESLDRRVHEFLNKRELEKLMETEIIKNHIDAPDEFVEIKRPTFDGVSLLSENRYSTFFVEILYYQRNTIQGLAYRKDQKITFCDALELTNIISSHMRDINERREERKQNQVTLVRLFN